MTSGCTRAQSFLPKLQLSVWLSFDLSLVPYYGADWRPLPGLFWANESAIKEHQLSVFSLSNVGDIFCTRLHRGPCQVGNRFALFMFSQHWAFFTFSFSQSQVKLPVDRWAEAEGAPQCQERRCSVDPTDLLWAPGASQACNGRRGWKKRGQEKSEMTPHRKDWSATWKTWRFEQTKEGRCLTLARWCVGMNVDIVNVQSFFPHFQSCWALLLFSNKMGHGKRGFFPYDYVVICKRDEAALIIMSVSVLV